MMRMANSANAEIRSEIKAAGLHIYDVADRIGIYETSLTRWMRRELTGERARRVRRALDELKEERRAENEIDDGKVGA